MRERDGVTAERNEAVKEVYWYSAEIVFSKLGFHLGYFFFLNLISDLCWSELGPESLFFWPELEFDKLEFQK